MFYLPVGGALCAAVLILPAPLRHPPVKAAALIHHEREPSTRGQPKTVRRNESASYSNAMDLELGGFATTHTADSHMTLPEDWCAERCQLDGFRASRDDHAIVKVQSFNSVDANLQLLDRPALVDHSDLQLPRRAELEEPMPIPSLRDGLEPTIWTNKFPSSDNSAENNRHESDDLFGRFRNRLGDFEPSGHAALTDALARIRAMTMFSMAVMAAFLSFLFLMFRDWIEDGTRRRRGMLTVAAAMACLATLTIMILTTIDLMLRD